MSAFSCFLDKSCLVFRKYFRIIFVYTDSGCDRFGCTVAVACHHDDLCKSCFMQFADHFRCLRTQRIFDADNSCQLTLDAKIQVRVFRRKTCKFFFFALRDRALLIFEYEVMASDDGFSSIYSRGDSVCYDIFYFRVHFFMSQAAVLSRIHDCFCHRMWEMLFHAGCKTKKIILGLAVKGNNIYYRRFCLGQCSCLIKYDGVCLSNCLQEFAALDCDLVCICFADRCKHGDRHCKFQSAGEVYHKDRQCLGHVSGEQVGKSCSCKCVRHKAVCKMFCLALYC